MKCPKCEYIRKPTDHNPDWQCPSCGIAYNKAVAPKPRPAASAQRVNQQVASSTGTSGSLIVAACGLSTSVITAFLIHLLYKLTGFNLFTFHLFVVVPVGALLVGFAAASGYYIGGIYFQKKASFFLFIQMVIIAGFTQYLIYYLKYHSATFETGEHVSNYITLGQYLKITLASAHFRSLRSAADLGSVGSFGYWLAVFDFIGILIGSILVFIYLSSVPVCGTCDIYYKPLAKLTKTFDDAGLAMPYLQTLFTHPMNSPEFEQMIQSVEDGGNHDGALMVKTILHGCPSCRAQMIEEKVYIRDGSYWKSIDKANRRVNVPKGLNLQRIFS